MEEQMKRFKKTVIIMMAACLLLGAKANDSKQVEETIPETDIQIRLCESFSTECIELL